MSFISLRLACFFLLLSAPCFAQFDISGEYSNFEYKLKSYKPSAKSTPDAGPDYDQILLNEDGTCTFRKNMVGSPHEFLGTWTLKMDTITCRYFKLVDLKKETSYKDKAHWYDTTDLKEPLVYTYILYFRDLKQINSKNIFTRKKYTDSYVGIIDTTYPHDGLYITDYGLKKQKQQADSLKLVEIRIKQTNDSITKLFVGKWKSQHIPEYQDRYPTHPSGRFVLPGEGNYDTADKPISNRQKKKLNKKYVKKYGYETYQFNGDGTYIHQYFAPKHNPGNLYSDFTINGFWKIHYESASPIGKCIVFNIDNCEGEECDALGSSSGFYVWNIVENQFFSLAKSKFSPEAILRNPNFIKVNANAF